MSGLFHDFHQPDFDAAAFAADDDARILKMFDVYGDMTLADVVRRYQNEHGVRSQAEIQTRVGDLMHRGLIAHTGRYADVPNRGRMSVLTKGEPT